MNQMRSLCSICVCFAALWAYKTVATEMKCLLLSLLKVPYVAMKTSVGGEYRKWHENDILQLKPKIENELARIEVHLIQLATIYCNFHYFQRIMTHASVEIPEKWWIWLKAC